MADNKEGNYYLTISLENISAIAELDRFSAELKRIRAANKKFKIRTGFLQQGIVRWKKDISSKSGIAARYLATAGAEEKNRAIQGSFHQLPFKDNFFDLVLCSLAMHMSTPKKRKKEKISERELVLREMNGVLRKKGYGIITLPHTLIDERDSLRFHNGLESLGFEVLPFSP